MGYLSKGNSVVLGFVGFILIIFLFRLSSLNVHIQEEINLLASKAFKDSRSGRAPTDIKVDTLAPCGEVCSYDGQIVKDKPSDIYSQITKNIDCVNIMRRMAYRHHNVTRPPPRKMPSGLMGAFTQHGKVPLRKPWYFDNMKNDARVYTTFIQKDIDKLVEKVMKGLNINPYSDGNCVMNSVKKYSNRIANRKAVVIGTLTPWLESMLLANDAHHVTTLEYNKLVYNFTQMSFHTPYSYAEMYLRGEAEAFDVAATFSSLEHSGLGRYGDPINPYGDLEAMAQIWCMLKPGGIAIVGVPGSLQGSSFMQWNAWRWYGPDRLQHLTASYDLVEAKKCKDNHVIFVLTKP